MRGTSTARRGTGEGRGGRGGRGGRLKGREVRKKNEGVFFKRVEESVGDGEVRGVGSRGGR